MQCKNGYTKPGVRGILCRKAEEPQDGDLKATAHALCGNQRFCSNQRCYQFLPGWEKCPKRREERQEAAETQIAPEASKPTLKKKRAQSASA